MANIGDGRPLRVCDLCGGVDDHPRHVIVGDPGLVGQPAAGVLDRVIDAAPAGHRERLVRDLLDTSSSDRHMDCCREAGCPDGTCNVVTAGAADKRGAALLMHLTRES